MRPILVLSHHHLSRPAFPPHAMSEWQYSQPHWDGSSEAQRRQPPCISSDPTAGVWSSFALPADSGFSSIAVTPSFNLADSGLPLQQLFSDVFPGMSQSAFHADISAPALRDATPLSWPAQFSYQPSGSGSDDPSLKKYMPGLYSLQPAPARISPMGSGTGDSFNDGYGIDLLMADYGSYLRSLRPVNVLIRATDEYTSSRSSAPPSSVPDDDASPPTVSVEIEPWNDAHWTSDDPLSEMFPVPEPNLDLVDEAPDMDARLGWEWKPSSVKGLDPEVSLEVGEFPNDTPLTDKQKIYALHRVKGCPSQFPFFSKRTAFLPELPSSTRR
ncbi:hypothetical protein FB451DRAFT_1414484 [Mycena latifolia]|nr:hypothetical protein FB451DRAFT_1414484 [Mycena latifolia]